MRTPYQSSRALCASTLLLAFAGAHAAGGYRVLPAEEALVKPGLSMQEVQQALGKPSQKAKFGSAPGPTWTYRVATSSEVPKVFDIDFSRDGRVISAGERILSEHNLPDSY